MMLRQMEMKGGGRWRGADQAKRETGPFEISCTLSKLMIQGERYILKTLAQRK
jgi:hypothetical protein